MGSYNLFAVAHYGRLHYTLLILLYNSGTSSNDPLFNENGFIHKWKRTKAFIQRFSFNKNDLSHKNNVS